MKNCSLSILSGGLTAIEALYAGMPSLNLYLSRSHQQVANSEAVKQQATYDCGVLSDSALEKMAHHIKNLSKDKQMLIYMRKQCKLLNVDDQGARRVVERILAQKNQSENIQPANLAVNTT